MTQWQYIANARVEVLVALHKWKGERQTDVDDVALLVNHDVAVVPVLDLEQEPDDTVGCHRLDEVLPRRLELLGRLVAVLVLEVGVEALVGLSTDLIT